MKPILKLTVMCYATTLLVTTAPPAAASAERFCAELDASWDGTNCTTSVTSAHQAEIRISLGLPVALLDHPVAAPSLRDYYHRLMEGWRRTGADDMVKDSSAFSDYQLYPGPGTVQSLIIHESFQPFGNQPNNAYRSFIFDMAQGRRITLGDIFKPGVDPLQVIPPAAAPLLAEALDSAPPPHQSNSYPFTVAQWTPGPDGPGYTGNYRAFGLATDHLILYLPDAPMLRENPSPPDRLAWSMDGGTVIVRVPLAALAAAMRPAYGGT